MAIPRTLFTEEHLLFRDSFVQFLKKEVLIHEEQWAEKGIVPRSIWRRCGELGFLCPMADPAYGGLGADFLYEVIIMEELSRHAETGLMLSLHNSLVAPYIYDYASEELKKELIPQMVSGEKILSIAMTEPDAGSDLASMKSTAIDKGDYWEITGSKTFISNGILSDAILVAAKVDPKNPRSMGIFVVDGDAKGLERGRNLKKLGMHSQDTAELSFDKVKVPKSHVLGDENMGFLYLMQKLAIERLICAISSVANCEGALAETVAYVKERKAFGKPISKFQNTKFKLADAHTKTQMARVYIDRLIALEIEGKLKSEDACGAKMVATDLACQVTDECLQLFGGYGYMMEYPISRRFADARVGKIFAGTNEIMKTIVAKGMEL